MGAVIFDMDGVLIDSEPHWRAAEVEVLAALGVPITEAACANTMGLRVDEAMQWWFDRHPWAGPDVASVTARVVHGVAARIRTVGRALPAMEALVALRHAGAPGAIATSSPWPIIEAVEARFPAVDRRTLPICSAEDDARGKPDPAVYLRAAAAIRTPPDQCLAIEDSAAGVAAAKAAGMRVIAVEPVPGADVVMAGSAVASWLHTHWSNR